MLDSKEAILEELKVLEKEYGELKNSINENSPIDDFTLRKFKKRKLFLKDKIAYLKSKLYEDILA